MNEELEVKNEDGAKCGKSDKSALLDAVHSGRLLTTWNGNDSGKLWERLWKWTKEEGYQSKLIVSGCFDGWRTYKNQDEFITYLKSDIADFRFCGI